jgi:hypothetical protein
MLGDKKGVISKNPVFPTESKSPLKAQYFSWSSGGFGRLAGGTMPLSRK